MSFQPNPRQALVMWDLLITRDEPAQSKVRLSTFTAADRKELLDAGLIALEKRGRAQHIVLTDKAWDWAPDHLNATISQSKLGASVLQDLLGTLQGFLRTHDMPLVELLTPPTAALVDSVTDSAPVNGHARAAAVTTDLPQRILAAYQLLSGGRSHTSVRLAELRAQLPDASRNDVDRTLLQMQRDGRLALMRMDDPQRVTPEDAKAALDIHGDKRHIVYLKG